MITLPTIENHFELPSALRKLSGMITMMNKLLKNGYIKKLYVDDLFHWEDHISYNSFILSYKFIINCNQNNFTDKFFVRD